MCYGISQTGGARGQAGMRHGTQGQQWPGAAVITVSVCVRLCTTLNEAALAQKASGRRRGQFSHPLPGLGLVRQAG